MNSQAKMARAIPSREEIFSTSVPNPMSPPSTSEMMEGKSVDKKKEGEPMDYMFPEFCSFGDSTTAFTTFLDMDPIDSISLPPCTGQEEALLFSTHTLSPLDLELDSPLTREDTCESRALTLSIPHSLTSSSFASQNSMETPTSDHQQWFSSQYNYDGKSCADRMYPFSNNAAHSTQLPLSTHFSGSTALPVSPLLTPIGQESYGDYLGLPQPPLAKGTDESTSLEFIAELESAQMSLLVLDYAGRFFYVSPHLCRLLGFPSPTSYLGVPIQQYLDTRDITSFADSLARCWMGEQTVPFSYELRLFHGQRQKLEGKGAVFTHTMPFIAAGYEKPVTARLFCITSWMVESLHDMSTYSPTYENPYKYYMSGDASLCLSTLPSPVTKGPPPQPTTPKDPSLYPFLHSHSLPPTHAAHLPHHYEPTSYPTEATLQATSDVSNASLSYLSFPQPMEATHDAVASSQMDVHNARYPELPQEQPPHDFLISAYSGDQPKEIRSGVKRKRSRISEEHQCTDCGTSESPEWRKGPNGPKTLCNACGLRWAKREKRHIENNTLPRGVRPARPMMKFYP